LHVSGMFSPERGCLAVMFALATHPSNKNEILAWDLARDPSELAQLDVATLRQRLFTKSADLPPGVQRLAIKSVHLNKSPMVISNLHILNSKITTRWNINIEQVLEHAKIAANLPDMSAIWPQVFQRPKDDQQLDVDEDLYGGFIGNADRRRLHQLLAMSPEELAHNRTGFDDPRLKTVLFRYRARNFPETLLPDEIESWNAHRIARLLEGEDGARNVDALFSAIDSLSETADERGEAILGALYDYAETIAPEI